eukprot:1165331-Prymnesium_polylepis.1
MPQQNSGSVRTPAKYSEPGVLGVIDSLSSHIAPDQPPAWNLVIRRRRHAAARPAAEQGRVQVSARVHRICSLPPAQETSGRLTAIAAVVSYRGADVDRHPRHLQGVLIASTTPPLREREVSKGEQRGTDDGEQRNLCWQREQRHRAW